ncbi:MAG TPA: hypothetical protein PKE61_09970 [Burkholderiaceae bacterium]|nr:hypothetical protein [Burkholderiaceae bacterium]HMY99382.1 hypothetical protein [Burkholderiaceae bacterium]HNG82581.1 hypothetical protein [Burkholderiaceae bacterium]
MKHRIESTDGGLCIHADVPPERQQALLDEFAHCAAGTCSCPSPQYAKVEALAVTPGADGVTVELQVKPGEVIDMADIERCLEHTGRLIGGG